MARADSFEDLLQKLLEQGCIKAWRVVDTDAYYSPQAYLAGGGHFECHSGVRREMLRLTAEQAPLFLATAPRYEVQLIWYAQLLLDGKFDRES